MSLSLEVVIILCLTVLYIGAQDCLRANSDGGDSLPGFEDPGNLAPHINVNPIQTIITSYQFHCCGIVAGWAAYVEPGGSMFDRNYSAKFQIWRPIAMSTKRYIKVGENTFNSVSLDPASEINETPPADERPHFQPGDVLGYYLVNELADKNDGGLQFDMVFDSEEVWYATGNSELQNECVIEVGSTGDLSLSTSLGPIISVSFSTTEIICPSTFTSTLLCPTPTSTPMASTVSPIASSPTTSMTTSIPIPSPQVTLPAMVSSPSPAGLQLVTVITTPSNDLEIWTSLTSALLSSLEKPPILPTPTRVLGVLTTGPPVVENIQLYVGIIIPVLTLVIVLVLTIAIFLTCVMKKRRVSQSVTVVSFTVVNQQVVQMTASSNSTTELSISRNEAYGKLEEPTSTHEYDYVNEVSSDPSIPTSQNPAYGDITTIDDDSINDMLDGSDLGMISNDAYVETNKLSSSNDPSIPTTENEAYTSVSADSNMEET